MTDMTLPGLFGLRRRDHTRHGDMLRSPEPLDHPELRGLGMRELADLPLPRYRRADRPAF